MLRITCSFPERPVSRSTVGVALVLISLVFRVTTSRQRTSVDEEGEFPPEGLPSQQASAHPAGAVVFEGGFEVLQHLSAQEAAPAMEHPLLEPGCGFAVDSDALAFGTRQELADLQEKIEAFDLELLLCRDDCRSSGAQQDSRPRASSALQIQPSASSLNWYCSRARRTCCQHGRPPFPRVHSEGT
jgi:hypothetical protein